MSAPLLWSEQQIATIIELYPDHTNEEIAEAVGKPLGSIARMGKNLGLRKDPEYLKNCRVKLLRSSMKSREWTERELKILVKNFPTKSDAQLHKLLPNRSINTIKSRASLMHLKRDRQNEEVMANVYKWNYRKPLTEEQKAERERRREEKRKRNEATNGKRRNERYVHHFPPMEIRLMRRKGLDCMPNPINELRDLGVI